MVPSCCPVCCFSVSMIDQLSLSARPKMQLVLPSGQVQVAFSRLLLQSPCERVSSLCSDLSGSEGAIPAICSQDQERHQSSAAGARSIYERRGGSRKRDAPMPPACPSLIGSPNSFVEKNEPFRLATVDSRLLYQNRHKKPKCRPWQRLCQSHHVEASRSRQLTEAE